MMFPPFAVVVLLTPPRAWQRRATPGYSAFFGGGACKTRSAYYRAVRAACPERPASGAGFDLRGLGAQEITQAQGVSSSS